MSEHLVPRVKGEIDNMGNVTITFNRNETMLHEELLLQYLPCRGNCGKVYIVPTSKQEIMCYGCHEEMMDRR